MATSPSARPTSPAPDAQEAPLSERLTLRPAEAAFLDAEPDYDDGPETEPAPPPSSAPRVEVVETRRVGSLLLFSVVPGSASIVLGLAVVRSLGHALLQ